MVGLVRVRSDIGLSSLSPLLLSLLYVFTILISTNVLHHRILKIPSALKPPNRLG